MTAEERWGELLLMGAKGPSNFWSPPDPVGPPLVPKSKWGIHTRSNHVLRPSSDPHGARPSSPRPREVAWVHASHLFPPICPAEILLS